jgi:replicative DNA helicase
MAEHSHPSDEEQAHPRRGGGPKFRVLTPREAVNRALPHSLEAEKYLLACLMLDGPTVMARCLDLKFRREWFYDGKHGVLFAALAELYQAGQPMEAAAVCEHLKTAKLLDQVGGYEFIGQVSSRVPTTAQAAFFIERVRDQAALRAVIREGTALVEKVYANTGGGEQLGGELEIHQAWIGNTLDLLRSGTATMMEAAKAAYQRSTDKLAGRPDRTRHLFTGLKEFDHRFGPFDANNEDWLVVIGAFQGEGKSSLARTLLLHNLRAGKSAQVFLLETGIGKFLELLACTAAEVPNESLARLPPDLAARFTAALDEMHGYLDRTLFVSDEVLPAETLIARINNHARRLGPADFVVIDHIHLLNALRPFTKREAEMGFIAKQLARCGKKHNRTIFGLAQLNRAARADGKTARPEPHHLRDSGEIEQAARRIVLLHTPPQDMRGAEQTKNQDQVMVELYQAKHNNGRSGFREFWFRRSLTKFFDIGDAELNTAKATNPSADCPPTKGMALRNPPRSP